MRTRNAAGAPRRPLPLCAGGRERGRLGLVTHLPPVPEGGRACLVPSRRRGGRGLSPPRTGDHPPTLDISQEFRVCVCVCVCERAHGSAALCKVLSPGLHRGEVGEPLQLCRALCLCDCSVCTRFELPSRLLPPSRICRFTGHLLPA